MDEQDKTFDILRRKPFDEMKEILINLPKPSPLIQLGNTVCNRIDYYSELAFQLERLRALGIHGWDLESFYLALEKESITNAVKDYNISIEFPQELLDRTLKSFPNAKFIPARIDLE